MAVAERWSQYRDRHGESPQDPWHNTVAVVAGGNLAWRQRPTLVRPRLCAHTGSRSDRPQQLRGQLAHRFPARASSRRSNCWAARWRRASTCSARCHPTYRRQGPAGNPSRDRRIPRQRHRYPHGTARGRHSRLTDQQSRLPRLRQPRLHAGARGLPAHRAAEKASVAWGAGEIPCGDFGTNPPRPSRPRASRAPSSLAAVRVPAVRLPGCAPNRNPPHQRR